MHPLVRALLLALALYLALVAFVWAVQRRLQYFPERASPAPPRDLAARGLVEVEIPTDDGERLKAWHWPGERALTFVHFHGNAGHRGHRLEWIEALRSLGGGVLALDYRGYGGSTGTPTQAGLYRDGEAVVRWLAERGAGPLVYVGESLGAGVAVETATRRAPAALALSSAFPSLVPVARGAYPWLPVGLLMRDPFESASKVARLDVPLFCVHGTADSIVPPELGRALFEAAAGPKTWWAVPGADHNDVPYLHLPQWTARLRAFLLEHGLLDEAEARAR